MRFTRKAMIVGAVGVALAGAAFAAEQARPKTILVALPDGRVERVQYIGDTPPRVTFVAQPTAPADLFEAAFGPDSTFAQMQRISAAMQAQSEAMFRQISSMAAQSPAAHDPGVTLTNAAGQPVGVAHFSYVSSSTDSNGCTQTVSYSSDGQSSQPKVVRTASDGCAAVAKPGVAPTVAPAPAAKAAPVVTPVSTPRPHPATTPTHII